MTENSAVKATESIEQKANVSTLKEQAIAAAASLVELEAELETITAKLAQRETKKKAEQEKLGELEKELAQAIRERDSALKCDIDDFEKITKDETNRNMCVLCERLRSLAYMLLAADSDSEARKSFDESVAIIENTTAKSISDQTQELIQWANDVSDVVGWKKLIKEQEVRVSECSEKVEKQKNIFKDAVLMVGFMEAYCAVLRERIDQEKQNVALLSQRLCETARGALKECARKEAALQEMLEIK